MHPLRIFFGDMAHNTVGLATDAFPLNIGYVAAYSKKLFGDDIEVALFKDIHLLEKAIADTPPDVLAMSNYPWCHNANMALFDCLEKGRPEAIRIMGGPNFPHDPAEQIRFLGDRPWLDTYVYLDGELGFANAVGKILETPSLEEAREWISGNTIDGCVHLSGQGKRLASLKPMRPLVLDDIPSPYLMGLLDPFFDTPFSPMISTNRGCPFSCTFCHDGNDAVNKVTKFSFERVQAEIDYIVERVPSTTHNLIISDLNFGMYKADIKICEVLAAARKRTGYPDNIKSTTGKNSKERVIETVEKLNGALTLSMSVQSLDEDVLSNIKRSNIKVSEIIGLQSTIRQSKLPTTSEIILGLPGETFESHKKTIGSLLDSDMDQVLPYTLMLVEGSEMSTQAERDKWGFKSKFRIIPLDFTKLHNGRNILEVEEVVIETNTLSFAEYIEARKLALLTKILIVVGFKPLVRYLREQGIKIMDVLDAMRISLSGDAETSADAPESLVKLFSDFENDTIGELWDSEEALVEFYQNDDNFKRLMDGQDGKNLMQHYFAFALSNLMQDIADWLFDKARDALLKTTSEADALAVFSEIEGICRGLSFDLLGPNRQQTTPECTSSYDYTKWLEDGDSRPLSVFKYPNPIAMRFIISDEQYRIVEDTLDRSGRTPYGLSRALLRISNDSLWRRVELPFA